MPPFGKTIAALESVSASLDKVTSKATAAAPVIAQTQKVVAEARVEFDLLDSLMAQSQATQNDFSAQFELDIQQVRLGSIDLRDFIQQWGDATIATTDGFRTIRELFSGADFGKYRQEIQELISAISDGGAKLADVLGFLKENVPDLANGLINVIELFQQGKATLEDVQRVIAATQAAFPGLEGDALLDAINNALAGGTL